MRAEGSVNEAIPTLAAQHAAYVVEQLATFIEFERDDANVHRFLAGGELYRPQTLMDIAAYVEALPAAKPTAPERGKAVAEVLASGKALYQSLCAACHLDDAAGDADHFIPALRGQHHTYLLAQLRRMAHGHRFAAPDELVEQLNRMSSADMEAIALYLEQLPAAAILAGRAGTTIAAAGPRIL
jgi:cytochrome c553